MKSPMLVLRGTDDIIISFGEGWYEMEEDKKECAGGGWPARDLSA
jgi:hypothetical protein